MQNKSPSSVNGTKFLYLFAVALFFCCPKIVSAQVFPTDYFGAQEDMTDYWSTIRQFDSKGPWTPVPTYESPYVTPVKTQVGSTCWA